MQTKVAILGAGFIADIHMESYHRFIPEVDVVAVYARNAEKAEVFAKKYHIPNCLRLARSSVLVY